MGTTIKIVLRKKQKTNDTYPLAIRITKDRKSAFIHTGYYIHEKDWDATNERVKKSHPNSVRLNNFLLTKKAEANNHSLELETTQPDVTAKSVRKKIKPYANGSVFAQADLFLERLKKDKKYNQLQAEEPRIKYLKQFLKNDIAFSDFTIPLIKRFKAWLKSERNVSERTAMNYLALIRRIFNQAIEEKLCDPKYYPFGKGNISIKMLESMKVGCNIEDVVAFENVDLSDVPNENHARNIWLFSFYFAGMRVSDVMRLKWSDFQNDRLFYMMGKNNKVDSLKVPDKAMQILDQYRNEKDETDLVFPDLKGLANLDDTFAVQVRIKTKLGPINRDLKEVAKKAGVNKTISMHISRHTFGNVSGDRIPVQMLQKLYRHSNILTTIGYQSSFINKSADDALEAVISG
ncbi:MAG: site-specific integrase [Chitinophagales bacterium]|nr:site-specific integrase [Chitinophagales bacterium]